MKKFSLVTLLFLFLMLIGCSKDNGENELQASLPSNEISNKAREGRCPPGTFEVWEYNFDEFRFKRPRFNCERGFWFCTVGGEWEFVGCRDQQGTVWPLNPTLTATRGTAVAYPNFKDKIITFLFPYGLVNKPGNNVDDFRIFSVDEEILIGDLKLKGGDYPTTFTANEIVIEVPFY